MAKPQYGYQHQQERLEALKQFKDGTLCWRCNRPMYHWQALDLDHVIPVAIVGTGPTVKKLAHKKCNRSAGASFGNRLRKNNRGKIKIKRRLPKW